MANLDRFKLLISAALLSCLFLLGTLLTSGQAHNAASASVDKALEQQMA
jgi:hypothetical protein